MMPNAQPGAAPTHPPSRLMWLMAGVLGASSLAAGATWLAQNREGASSRVAASTPAATAAVAAEPTTLPASVKPSSTGSAKVQPSAATPSPTAATAAAPVCHNCGVVESVRAYTVKGEGSGIGAVAGGVLGAAVGNQMGKGDGRKAMTVLGALGGGMAGHEVEKRNKSTTLHEVTVRMNDGSVRAISQSAAPRIGTRVRVEGQSLKELG